MSLFLANLFGAAGVVMVEDGVEDAEVVDGDDVAEDDEDGGYSILSVEGVL